MSFTSPTPWPLHYRATQTLHYMQYYYTILTVRHLAYCAVIFIICAVSYCIIIITFVWKYHKHVLLTKELRLFIFACLQRLLGYRWNPFLSAYEVACQTCCLHPVSLTQPEVNDSKKTSSGKFQPLRGGGSLQPPSSCHLTVNEWFASYQPSTTMHCIPCARSFVHLLVIKINFSAKQSTTRWAGQSPTWGRPAPQFRVQNQFK